MVSLAVTGTTPAYFLSVTTATRRNRAFVLRGTTASAVSYSTNYGCSKPFVVVDSLKLLEWDKVCDSVASFAATSLAKQALKEQLWFLDQSFEESLKLLKETNAAVQMNKYGATMDLSGIDVTLVKSAIQNARWGFHISGSEAIALAALLEFAESLQSNVKAAIKDDADWQQRFMPLSEIIMELVVNRSLLKFIRQLVDHDGTVKDSASGALRQARDKVRFLERKVYQLIESLIRKEMEETPSLEVSNVDGRWCIRSDADVKMQGLLLSSGSGAGSILEPLAAVPLNDELQQARASVVKAEADVLLKITKMMQSDLHDTENIFDSMIRLDVINARARYSLSFGGTCPDLFLREEKDRCLTDQAHSVDRTSMESHPTQRKWTLYLPKAYHPLLLQQHRQCLLKAVKDLKDAKAEVNRRRQQRGTINLKEEANIDISVLEMQVAKLKQSPPVPIDIFVGKNTRVVVITGPNTGGKTICLKTIGLAAIMAKSGLYVISSEPVRIPWFDSVFADIGDEQSLSQSLSTFSGHLKQISEIRSHSTSMSLVLLDEVGAGTNPLEGAALGMALLESFAESGALFTMASTHHGELKTLKYSNDAFENACMEFDEVNLKPTYKILWGVPGRSNAINIAERIGIPDVILEHARMQYGAASAEINEIIVDMERFKQNFHERIHEGQRHMMLAKDLHQRLLLTREKVRQHAINQRHTKAQEISEIAAKARSALHLKVRERRTKSTHQSRGKTEIDTSHKSNSNFQQTTARTTQPSSPLEAANSIKDKQLVSASSLAHIKDSTLEPPKVGSSVYVPSLNKKATVLQVELSKGEIVVQAGLIKLKLRLTDVVS